MANADPEVDDAQVAGDGDCAVFDLQVNGCIDANRVLKIGTSLLHLPTCSHCDIAYTNSSDMGSSSSCTPSPDTRVSASPDHAEIFIGLISRN